MARATSASAAAPREARLALAACQAFGWGVPLVFVAAFIAMFAVWADHDARGAWTLAVFAGAPLFWGSLSLLRPRRLRPRVRAGCTLPRDVDPQLWGTIGSVADRLQVDPPGALRLTPDADVAAWHDGEGLVLAIGLPWLAPIASEALPVAIAHALAAHRAGAGSTAMLRFEDQIERAEAIEDGWLFGAVWRPFVATARRLQAWLAERQTAAARAACAAVLGAGTLGEFDRCDALGDAFARYWAEDVGPCLEDGFAPPLLEGWAAFVEPVNGGEVRDERPWGDARHAALERRLLAAVLPDTAPRLVGLPWQQAPGAVWLPRMRRRLAEVGADVPRFTPATLSLAVAAGRPGTISEAEWPHLVAAALMVALVDAGWEAVGAPGAPLGAGTGEHAVYPFGLCQSIADEACDLDGWADFAADAEIEDLLVDVAALASAEGAGPLAAATAPPPMADQRLALARPPGQTLGWVSLILLTLAALPSGVLLLAAAPSAPSADGTVIAVVLGVGVLAALAVWGRARLSVLTGRGTLVVGSNGLRVDYPSLLKEPFCVPRESVRAVLVDDGDWTLDRRFPIGAPERAVGEGLATSGRVGWLWTREAPTVVPLLGHGTETPNLALLVDDPLLAPKVRRVVMTGPIPGEALTALLFAVEDAAGARAALAPWGRTRHADVDDARRIQHGFSGAAATVPLERGDD